MEFRLLGEVEARTGTGPVELGTARQQTVLAALLVEANRPVTVDQLEHRVWGDSPPQRATQTLYGYVSRLRRVLPGVIARGPGGGYVLTADESTVDVHRFHRLLGQAPQADDDSRAVALFQEALALWRGEPFPGADTPWFNAARDTLRKERWAAELDCADLRLRLGEHAPLLAMLAEHSAAHPLDERLAAQYMLALYRCGRQADALAHYQRLRGILAEQLGIDPGQELQHLHQAILSGDAKLSAPTARATVRGPVGMAWDVQCQLPLAARGFVGRSELIQRIEESLAPPAAVPVVVSGSPGVGKTALAVHLGHRLRPVFPDGQWHVQLLGTTDRPRDPAEVLSGLLRASGQDADTIPQALEDRAAAFRSRVADRRVLLILDDAADAEQIRPLLPGTAGTAVLVTSRRDLWGLTASHAAHIVPLEVLELPEAITLLAQILGEQRVEAEPEAAARLAELCARLPLALRIAAANLAARPGRSITRYAEELAEGNRLAKLAIVGDRQAAVRTAFDHSHAALEPIAARLFALLGLHPGPDFTTEAAAALLDAKPTAAEYLLDQLVTAGLVQRTTADRFQFHDLLRLYAAEHAHADPDRASAWQRLGAWYLATTDAATAFDYSGRAQLPRPRAESHRFADRDQAFAWLEEERTNLVAVIRQAAETGPRAFAWHLADQLRMYLYHRRHQPEWEAATTTALRAAERDGETLAQASMQHSLGLLRLSTGEVETALDTLHGALDGYRSTGFAPGEAAILSNLALLHGQQGQMRKARDCQEQGIEILRSLDRGVQLSGALNTLTVINSFLGELGPAVEHATEAIQICLKEETPQALISPLINRGLAYHGLGRYEEALTDGTEALRRCRDHQERHNEASAQTIVAITHRDTGHADLAASHAEQALQAARESGDSVGEIDALITSGSVEHLRGAPHRATSLLDQALTIAERHGFRQQRAEVQTWLAHARLAAGDASRAADHAERALTTAHELELRPIVCLALEALAAVGQATGDPTAAALHTAEAEQVARETSYCLPPVTRHQLRQRTDRP